jgi:hypothetical protein
VSIALPIVSARSVPASTFHPARIAGFAGLAFALLVAAVNIVVGALSPPAADAGATEIVAFFADNEGVLKAAMAVVPIPVVALFVFLGASYPRFSAASREAALWARVGAAGLILVEVVFLARATFELVLLANAEELASEPALVETLWQLQSAAMTFNGLALAVALLGLSRAGRLSGLLPAWQETMGLLAALGFVVAAMAATASLEGAAIGIIGLPAFLAWLVWLALTSLRLMRSGDETA